MVARARVVVNARRDDEGIASFSVGGGGRRCEGGDASVSHRRRVSEPSRARTHVSSFASTPVDEPGGSPPLRRGDGALREVGGARRRGERHRAHAELTSANCVPWYCQVPVLEEKTFLSLHGRTEPGERLEGHERRAFVGARALESIAISPTGGARAPVRATAARRNTTLSFSHPVDDFFRFAVRVITFASS